VLPLEPHDSSGAIWPGRGGQRQPEAGFAGREGEEPAPCRRLKKGAHGGNMVSPVAASRDPDCPAHSAALPLEPHDGSSAIWPGRGRQRQPEAGFAGREGEELRRADD
jgi:hypothetical protein